MDGLWFLWFSGFWSANFLSLWRLSSFYWLFSCFWFLNNFWSRLFYWLFNRCLLGNFLFFSRYSAWIFACRFLDRFWLFCGFWFFVGGKRWTSFSYRWFSLSYWWLHVSFVFEAFNDFLKSESRFLQINFKLKSILFWYIDFLLETVFSLLLKLSDVSDWINIDTSQIVLLRCISLR